MSQATRRRHYWKTLLSACARGNSRQKRSLSSLLEAVLKQLPCGVIIANPSSGDILLANSQAIDVFKQDLRADGRAPSASTEATLPESLSSGWLCLDHGASFHYFFRFGVGRGVEVPQKSSGRVADNPDGIRI